MVQKGKKKVQRSTKRYKKVKKGTQRYTKVQKGTKRYKVWKWRNVEKWDFL